MLGVGLVGDDSWICTDAWARGHLTPLAMVNRLSERLFVCLGCLGCLGIMCGRLLLLQSRSGSSTHVSGPRASLTGLACIVKSHS